MDLNYIRNLAIELHGEQKYGDKPYIYHLDLVYELAKKMNLSEDYLVAAYLHDTLEDTNLTRDKLRSLTNENVEQMVWAVTGFGNNRAERKQSMLQKMESYPDSINLKMIDRYVNINESKKTNKKFFDMYVKEMSDYDHLFQQGDARLYQMLKDLCFSQNTSLKKNKM